MVLSQQTCRSNGCQIIPPQDEDIAAAIEANLDLWPLPADIAKHALLSDPYERVTTAYYQRLQKLCFKEQQNNAAQQVTYTPLHGVGAPAVREAFKVNTVTCTDDAFCMLICR